MNHVAQVRAASAARVGGAIGLPSAMTFNPVFTACLLLSITAACMDTPTDSESDSESASESASETGSEVAARRPTGAVDLGTTGDFAILAKSGISTVPASSITGDLGVSPIAATGVTGFSLIADASNTFASSSQVTGRVYAASYRGDTPSNLTTAVGDMEHAFTDAAGRDADVTELGAGAIGGMTLEPAVYKWSSAVLVPTSITLRGSSTDVWIFEIAQGLTLSSGSAIILAGGARPENVFWQVSGSVTLGTTAHLEGIVLGQTAITLATGASVNGRLLAQTAVTLDASTVVAPTR